MVIEKISVKFFQRTTQDIGSVTEPEWFGSEAQFLLQFGKRFNLGREGEKSCWV
jgi:hypothetical protein